MAKILRNENHRIVVELSSTIDPGYRWLSASRLLAQIDAQGVAFCAMDASEDDHPVTRLELGHAEMVDLIKSYQSYVQAIEARQVSGSSDEDLGDIDDHPF